jgi:hypothetical protein
MACVGVVVNRLLIDRPPDVGVGSNVAFQPDAANFFDTIGHRLLFRLRWQHVRCTELAGDLSRRSTRQPWASSRNPADLSWLLFSRSIHEWIS